MLHSLSSNRLLMRMGAQASTERDTSREVTFVLHGEVHTVKASSDITPQTSLNSYLRNHAGLRGTKGMCYEGGCGACVVAVTIKHPITKKERTLAINSCLIPILSCHGWTINTVEGIGNRVDGYHPIQKTLAKFHGTQCGFCSGGMVMNMYALYESNDMLTMKDVENSFGGSLCRCTGYRPIMEAFKSLTTDADPALVNKYPDIEDIKICSKTGKQCSGTCKPVDDMKPICLKFSDNDNWYKVYSIDDILELFQSMGDSPYRLVAGNTGNGVYKISKTPEFWIDVLSVPELISHKLDGNLTLGGNMSLTETMAIMLKIADEDPNFWHLRKVHKHLDLVANVPVRNVGTIAGNLSLKHAHNEFPSDVFLLLETINAQLAIVDKNGSVVTKSLVDYLKFDMNKCIIKSVIIPPLDKDKYLFESYKICPRVQNAHAYVNAAFLVEHDGNFKVKSARLCIGGINPEFLHATNTEAYLVDKNLIDNGTLQAALEKLKDEVKPDSVLLDASPEFRKDLAMSLFYKFVLACAPKDKVNSKFQSGGSRLERPLSSGKQTYETKKDLYPLTQPIAKLEGVIQCSGEAQYLNDMPPIQGELFGAFVLAEAAPYSKIKSIDSAEALAIPGVRAYIDHKDVPGSNTFSPPSYSRTVEQLFCVDKVMYNGQPVGMIIANTHDQAVDAAKMVKITFEESKEVPVFSVKDVLQKNQKNKIIPLVNVVPKRKGDNTKKVIKGTFEVGGQYHFTMETQSAICVPTDNGEYDLYSATQWIDHAQSSAAKALNIPMNKINISVKRLGGAYGGKIFRASLISTACAVAAHKMNKPVRVQLPLIENMKMIGKRMPVTFDYEAGVDDNGLIQHLNITYYQDTGLSGLNEATATFIPHLIPNSYLNDSWKLTGSVVLTDMPGNAFCRAPGTIESIGMIESVMDHIAYEISKDPIQVRLANVQPGHDTMPQIVKEMISISEYEQRKKTVEDYNSKNRWMKKGISLIIMQYPFEIFGPFSVFVSVYASDGTVAIAHGGVECGQGINTKVAQVCAHILGIPLDMISIKASNSLTTPNNAATGGSITSEAVCYGTIQACNEILKRLEPVKEKMKNPSWTELVAEGYKQNVELCATHMFSTSSNVKPYPIYGACTAEVQVDLLTGEHNIIRVDLLEDVGQSMSPEIDVGQIEGAFIMGLGYYTCENLIYDDKGGLLSNSTWTYKVPGVKDIPADFRVKFRQDSTNPVGVLNSKATGEPPLCLSISIPLAIRRALAAARMDADKSADQFVPIAGPTTVEYTFQNALNDYKTYTL